MLAEVDVGDSCTKISPISHMTFDDDAKITSMRAFWSETPRPCTRRRTTSRCSGRSSSRSGSPTNYAAGWSRPAAATSRSIALRRLRCPVSLAQIDGGRDCQAIRFTVKGQRVLRLSYLVLSSTSQRISAGR
jgi:hypothetical protein